MHRGHALIEIPTRLDGKNPPGGQNDAKIIPLLRKRYRFRVDLHMCTMMQNHCIMCTHGIPNMEKLQGFRKIEKWLPWMQILSLGWEEPSGGSK